MNVQQWRDLQLRLINHAKSDPALKNPSRVMRHPGFHYIDENDQPIAMVTIINATGNRYLYEELDACLPPLPVPQPPPRQTPFSAKRPKRRQKHRSAKFDEIVDAIQVIPPRIPGSGTYPTYRNLLWGLMAAMKDAGYSEEKGIELMELHSPQWTDIRQVANSGGDQIGAGTFWHIAKQHGWRRHGQI